MATILFDGSTDKPQIITGTKAVDQKSFSVATVSYHSTEVTVIFHESKDSSIRFCSLWHDDIFNSQELLKKVLISAHGVDIIVPWLWGRWVAEINSFSDADSEEFKKALQT